MKEKFSYLNEYFNYYVDNGVVIVTSVKKGKKEIIIPDVVSIVTDNAFDSKCNDFDEKIEKVVFPSSIYKLGKKLFQSNMYIKSVIIDSNIIRIEDSFFSGASRLEEIILPSTLRYVGKESFRGIRCKEVFVPRNCEIDENAFSDKTMCLKGPYYLRDLLIKEYEIKNPRTTEARFIHTLSTKHNYETIVYKNLKEKEIENIKAKYEKLYKEKILPLEEKEAALNEKLNALKLYKNSNDKGVKIINLSAK